MSAVASNLKAIAERHQGDDAPIIMKGALRIEELEFNERRLKEHRVA
jgi:hypothetical protein